MPLSFSSRLTRIRLPAIRQILRNSQPNTGYPQRLGRTNPALPQALGWPGLLQDVRALQGRLIAAVPCPQGEPKRRADASATPRWLTVAGCGQRHAVTVALALQAPRDDQKDAAAGRVEA